jgi:hypothetical protein
VEGRQRKSKISVVRNFAWNTCKTFTQSKEKQEVSKIEESAELQLKGLESSQKKKKKRRSQKIGQGEI